LIIPLSEKETARNNILQAALDSLAVEVTDEMGIYESGDAVESQALGFFVKLFVNTNQ
jgi:hypothetical protein